MSTICIPTVLQRVALSVGNSHAGVHNVIPDIGNYGLDIWNTALDVGGGGVGGLCGFMTNVRDGCIRVYCKFGLEVNG